MRAHFTGPVTDNAGNLLPGTVVSVYVNGTTTLISNPVWADGTSAVQLGNPFISSNGVVNFYLDNPQRVDLGISAPGQTPAIIADIDVNEAGATSLTLSFPGSGTHSTQLGASSVASASQAVAYGDSSSATGTASTALGQNAQASGASSTATGQGSQASASQAVADGAGAIASAPQATSVGYLALANASGGTAIGSNASAVGTNSTAIGINANAALPHQIVLGTVAETVVIPGTLNIPSSITRVVPSNDLTGATDSANISASLASSGVALLSNGSYYVTAGAISLGTTQAILHLGERSACIIYQVGASAGATITVHNTGAFSRDSCSLKGFTVDGSMAASGAVGIELGDIVQSDLDVKVQNFTGAGFHFFNKFFWTEQAHGNLYVRSCNPHVLFDVDPSATVNSRTGSFERCRLNIWIEQNNATYDGVVFQNGAFINDGQISIYGNFNGSASALTSAVLRVTGSTPAGAGIASVSNISWSQLDINVEAATGFANYPFSIFADTSNNSIGIFNCYGAMDFGAAGNLFAAAHRNANAQFTYNGQINGDDSLLSQVATNPWTTISSLTPAGWTGQVRLRRMPQSGLFVVKFELTVPNGFSLTNNTAICTVAAPFIPANTQRLTGGVFVSGVTGIQLQPFALASNGVITYNGASTIAFASGGNIDGQTLCENTI